jgi:hypothetical protein
MSTTAASSSVRGSPEVILDVGGRMQVVGIHERHAQPLR